MDEAAEQGDEADEASASDGASQLIPGVMRTLDMQEQSMNPLGERIRDSVLRQYPQWSGYVDTLAGGDLELAVPASKGSRAGHLVIFTASGEDIWIRYSPPRMCYSVESEQELHAVIAALLGDRAFFLVVSNGDEWIETSLLRPGEEPVLAEGQVANVVSWSGVHDRIVTYMPDSPTGAA